MSLKEPYDHVDRGLERITFALQKEDFEKYLRIFLEVYQEFEIDILDFAKKKDIYTADGYWLDRIGDVVGEPRIGRDDETYRIAILFRVAVNNSDGTPAVMTRLIKQFTQADNVHLSERFPAFGHIYLNGGQNHTDALLDMVDQIKPVGTSWVLQTEKDTPTHTFTWEVFETYPDSFLVTLDGTDFEVFNVTMDGEVFQEFLVDVYVPDADHILDRTLQDTNFLAWEFADWLRVTLDGTNFENFYLDTEGGELLKFPEIVGGTTGGSPFVWEIQEGSIE